ncbi:50S ribosomal protein L11 methyltransferase [Ammoniphilus sp. CFH 90114]|uniref:50S ribosomal protein L11 methyltransferase n=1 Tax=Ammoniphilus sp. CFH 90114 TaxID=2493665 RepID=UPI00100EAD39|nr:50S ribosomal protein L11 methyltransferase [Ammoniphilus sp. CFH 90114]RXT15499.1 50S ribosomal protein L11 methyltransferase [Ammoniphilus sp. CFH 90114]
MKWSEISIHTTQEAVEAVSNILHEAGASGVVIEDPEMLHREWDVSYGEIYQLSPNDYPEEGVIVKAYLPINGHIAETVEEIKQRVQSLEAYDIPIGRAEITLAEVHEEEWAIAWKKYYKPVRISERITITPTWEDYTPASEEELIIELDPGMAFGTGTHPTTVLCIRALEKYLQSGDEVIDVGCGSGILSIAAAKLGAKSVLAMDLDEVAVKSTFLNSELNQVEGKINIKQNNLLEGISTPVDLIVSNILAEIIVRFVDDAYSLLPLEGMFITSGIIGQKEQEVREALIQAGFDVIEVQELEDWVSIVAKKK